ncbi:MAG: 4Fe-4S binding protein [Planctomycetes bacterium]|nr:4Fe-4S binding protein [Planctomycetota bacterium]
MPKQLRDFEVYLVHVDEDRCDGCGECVRYCPVDVFEVHGQAAVVRPENCLGCTTCVAVCPSAAVVVTEI